MTKVLIINGGANFQHSKGKLNESLALLAKDFLQENSCSVKTTNVSKGYDSKEELEKFLWADIIIYQMPAWWMGTPWFVKKYLDEVFMEGVGKMFTHDGRTPENPTQGYGTGGLLQNKKYMLCVTWNAPKEAFDEKDNFFEGKGVDAVYFPFHKANEFVGMKSLKTFMLNDVIKNPQIEKEMELYKKHLKEVIL